MRIGLSTSVIQRGKTGVAQYVFALLRALVARSDHHQFTLFVLEEDRPLFDFVAGQVRLVSVSERFRPPVANIFWHQAYLPRLARAHALDVLHIPSYRRLVAAKPCALVATIHDLAPFHVQRKYDWKRMFYGRVIAKNLARRQDALIAISKNTARDVTRFFGIPPERLTVILNGLAHDRFFPGDRPRALDAVAARHGLRRPFFLYLARLEHPAKNHVRLLDAFDRFKQKSGSDWQLVFGGSDWHGAEHVHRAIQRSPFATDVRVLGFVPESALPDLYRAADAFVYPSLYEGFGLPPLEAMACHCPVIASTRGSLGEVIGEAALPVEPEDIDAMAEQMRRLVADPALRARLQTAGLAQARKFDWNLAAAATLEVYERAIRPANQPVPAPATLPG
jgi:glycosyltransferase involved in cell wall biosynthesis